jgi:hypothetical protein
LNGDPADNRWTNLAWGTRRENVHDAISHGTHPRGERNGKARLNGEAARAIFLDDRDPSIVAASYGVVRQTVIDIKNRRTWKHVNAASA